MKSNPISFVNGALRQFVEIRLFTRHQCSIPRRCRGLKYNRKARQESQSAQSKEMLKPFGHVFGILLNHLGALGPSVFTPTLSVGAAFAVKIQPQRTCLSGRQACLSGRQAGMTRKEPIYADCFPGPLPKLIPLLFGSAAISYNLRYQRSMPRQSGRGHLLDSLGKAPPA